MRILACSWTLGLLLLGLGCNGDDSGDDDNTSFGTVSPTTSGSDTTGGTTEVSTTSASTAEDDDTTGPPPGTTTTTTGPDVDTSGSDDTTTAGMGDPGDWLLTVDRGSSPPRLMKIPLTGGAVEVCTLAAVADYASIAFTRDGTLYGLNVAAGRMDVINPCNCSFQIVGETSLGPVALSLSDNDEQLLGVDAALDALVRVDLDTGLGTVVGPLGYFFGNAAITWSSALAQPYTIEAENDFIYTVAPGTGAATPGQPLTVDLVAPGLAVHPNDGVIYACDADILYTIDFASGLMTPVGAPLGLTGGCTTLTPPQTAVECIDVL